MGGLGLTARPATVLDAMEIAGGRAFLRKAMVWQVRTAQAEAICRGGEVLAIVLMRYDRKRRVNAAICFGRSAHRHMLALVKLAQLTVSRLAQDGVLTFVHVRVSDARAHRMARLAGFRPGGFANPTIWITAKGTP